MKRVKGCLNSNCKEYRKTYYKESDEYCVKCGTKLSYVCKQPKCFKQIPDDAKEKYCPIHAVERQDKKEKRNESLKKLGSGALAVCGAAVAVCKTVIDIKNHNN